MLVNHYCEYCEKEVETYEGRDGNPHCVHCDHVVEENVDICEVCGKPLDNKGDGNHICKECAEKYATAEYVEDLLKDEYTCDEAFTHLVKLFLDKDQLKKEITQKIVELFNPELGCIADAAKSLLVKEYMSDESYYLERMESWEKGEKLSEE